MVPTLQGYFHGNPYLPRELCAHAAWGFKAVPSSGLHLAAVVVQAVPEGVVCLQPVQALRGCAARGGARASMLDRRRHVRFAALQHIQVLRRGVALLSSPPHHDRRPVRGVGHGLIS